MSDSFHLQVITPREKFYDGDIRMVELTTSEGGIGVYRNHIPLTAIVVPGTLKIHEEEKKREALLEGGFLEILPEKTTIFTDDAKWLSGPENE